MATVPLKRDPHRLTYRVRRIPSTWTVDNLKAALLGGLCITDESQVRIRVLATDLGRFNRERCRTAVVSFGLENRSFPARFPLYGSGVKLDCDTVFDDLTPLSSCDGDERHKVDCIVIPGWAGHPIGSFMAEDSPYLWILDGLGSDFPHLRVWTYGYGGSLTQQGSGEDVYEFADSFVRSLRRLRLGLGTTQKQRPVIYIAHSLGGMVFKEAIIRMQRGADAILKDSVIATYGALFFAVPSAGMDVEALATMVGDLPARTTLHELDARIGQRLRLRQHLDFCEAFQFEDSVLARFYELHESRTVEKSSSGEWSRTGKLRRLVTLSSASLGRPWETDEEFITGLEGDHSTLVKLPDYYREKRYDRISDVLEKFLTVANEVIASRFRLLSTSSISHSSEGKLLISDSAKRKYNAFRLETDMTLIEEQKEKERAGRPGRPRAPFACLASLSFCDIGSRYNRVEQNLSGTCQWIFETPEYLEWLSSGRSRTRRSFLWIKGKAGSGKSTLMKAIVEKIRALPVRPIVIRFFFDARGNLLERSPLGLFRTLTKELISERPQLIEQLLPLYQELLETRQGEWRMHTLHQWFKQMLEDQLLGPVYIFIDALDECDEDEVDQRISRDHDTNARTLVRFFEDLMISSAEPKNSLLLCLSSRHYPHVTVRNDVQLFEVFMEGQNDQDIRTFIESTLASSSLETDLKQADLFDMILRRSRGVFLWVVLVTRALLRARDQGRPRSQWRVILEGLPTTLNELFRQIMSNLEDKDEPDSAALFQVLIFEKEAMSLDRLRLIFGFAVDEPPASLKMWKQSDLYLSKEAFKKRVRDLSCGLIEVKDDRYPGEPHTVQFIHETVRTFFMENNYATLAKLHPNIGQSPSEGACEIVMQAWLNYLSTSEIIDAASDRYDCRGGHGEIYSRIPYLRYAVLWLGNCMRSTETISSAKLQVRLHKCLGGPSNGVFEMWRNVYYSWEGRGKQNELDFYIKYKADFFDYASIHGLFYSVLAGLKDSSGAGPQTSWGVTPLMRLLSFKCDNIAQHLLSQGVDIKVRDSLQRSVLFYPRSVEMVDILLDAGAEVNGIWTPPWIDSDETRNPKSTGIGLNALMFHIDDAEIVECLLRHGADVNETSLWGKTALHYVSSEAVARLILSKGPDCQIKDLGGRTASDHARQAGRNEIARLIEGYHEGDNPSNLEMAGS